MGFMDMSLARLPDLAAQFVVNLPKTLGSHAHVVGLSGELGSGKTTFVQAVARALGVTQSVTSPTFVIVKRYSIKHSVFTALIHADAYRLKSGDAHTIGWFNYIKDPRNLIMVEWPENMFEDFPSTAMRLRFTVVDVDTRTCEYVF